MKRTRVAIAFPYKTADEETFEKLYGVISAAHEGDPVFHTSSRDPVLVVNRDSITAGGFDSFLAYGDERGIKDPMKTCDVLRVYSVDTCQMWLSGFGRILDDNQENLNDEDEVILQLPGDLKDVQGDLKDFLGNLNYMAHKTDEHTIIPVQFRALVDEAASTSAERFGVTVYETL